jgi:glucose-1-phosphate adenylyltransferase
MQSDRIIAFVMAGGQGSRLQPLTAARSKPSVPSERAIASSTSS